MGRTRDIIQEIAAVRQRRLFGSAMTELPMRLLTLEQAFKNHDKKDVELIRYFPVALIACVEGYFRMAIKELIDSGEPYFSNAEKPMSSLKLDFSMLRALHGKKITVGELVAHWVQLSKLEHINHVLTGLLGKGFLDVLRKTPDRFAHEVMGTPVAPILSEPDKVYFDVARTFELRHIICHELASAYEINSDEVAECFESCVAFLKAADVFISETIHPGAPLTQSDMNIAAGESLNKKREMLDKAIHELCSRLDETELDVFIESQTKWQQYCDAWVCFVAGGRDSSGSIWPLIYAGAAEAVVENRINQLNSFKRLSDEL
ncbi:MAG: DUF1311 domain-containing protein [Desulfobulbaceae bacterium]|nr:DUF1311 domain-containing protein [Desulfobulbaceae bacterium]